MMGAQAESFFSTISQFGLLGWGFLVFSGLIFFFVLMQLLGLLSLRRWESKQMRGLQKFYPSPRR